MTDPAQPMTTQGHAGVFACPTGQGVTGNANAVSAGSHPDKEDPQPMSVVAALAGIGMTEGAKTSIAAISTVLTIFRMYLRIAAPLLPGTQNTFAGVTVLGCARSIETTIRRSE